MQSSPIAPELEVKPPSRTAIAPKAREAEGAEPPRSDPKNRFDPLKVERLRKAVLTGSYVVDARAIANRILEIAG